MIAFEEEERYADGVLGGLRPGRQRNDVPIETYENGPRDIFAAARVGDSARVQSLLNSNCVDVLGSCDDDENTPIHIAAACGHEDVVALLSENSACVEAKNRHGRSPLYCAVLNRHTTVVKHLISVTADVNAADTEGNTPLLHAIREEHVDVVRLLLANSAASCQRNLNGITLMKIATHKRNPAIIGLLKNHEECVVHRREIAEAVDLFPTTCLPSIDSTKAFAQSLARYAVSGIFTFRFANITCVSTFPFLSNYQCLYRESISQHENNDEARGSELEPVFFRRRVEILFSKIDFLVSVATRIP